MLSDDVVPAPIPLDPSTYRGDRVGTSLFEIAGGQFFTYKWAGYNSAVDAYERCPPLSAIINRKAQAFVNGKTFILNDKEKEAKGADADKMRKLLSTPNILQSGMQFEAQGYIYMQLFGFNIILPIKPIGFTDNLDASSLWNIPASWIDINATQEIFARSGGVGLKEIAFNFNGVRTIIPVADLIIIRDFTPSFSTLTFPGSKLQPMEKPINNIIGAYDSRNTLMNHRGALGILSRDAGSGQYEAMGIGDEEKAQLQADFKKYGLRSRQWHIIITQAQLKWQQMGYPTKDLLLMEEVTESTRAICAGQNFPPFILGLADTTYNNMSAAEKGLYQNATIPDAANYYDQITTAFNLRNKNLYIVKDYSHIPSLQEDKEVLARGRLFLDQAYTIEYEKGLITKNQWRVALGEDPVNGDDIYIGDIKQNDEPLAVTIGVGGVTALISMLTAQGLSDDARQAALEIVFGLTPDEAARMAVSNANGQQNNTTGQPAQANSGATGTAGQGAAPAGQSN